MVSFSDGGWLNRFADNPAHGRSGRFEQHRERILYAGNANTRSLHQRHGDIHGSRNISLHLLPGKETTAIIVENTAQVLLRAAIENGTGEYMQLYTDTSITSNTVALQYVQAILAAYDSIPVSYSFEALVPGLASRPTSDHRFRRFRFSQPASLDER